MFLSPLWWATDWMVGPYGRLGSVSRQNMTMMSGILRDNKKAASRFREAARIQKSEILRFSG